MKQRNFVLAAMAMMPFAVAVAQTPPTPPTQPTPATRPTPAPTATPTPAATAKPTSPVGAAVSAPLLPGQYIDSYQMEEIRRAADEARREAQRAMEDSRWEIQRAQEDARRAMKDVRVELPHFDYNFGASFGQSFGANFALAAPVAGQPGVYSPKGQYQWIQGDPADSLYQLASEARGRYDYSRAAARYAEVIAKYPNYRRFAEAVYWQAFSQYRIGTLETLRQGLKVLEDNESRLSYQRRNDDTPALQGRILRALLDRNRNEPGVEAKLKALYEKYPASTCDTDNIGIQSQVLNSLYHSDPDAALPHIRTALSKRDPCTARLRADAVMLLANRPSEDKAAILIQVAKTDTAREVRTRAIEMLSRMPGDAAINTLTELMKDNDEYVQGAAVRSLMRSDNTRARAAIKTTMIDQRTAPESQRLSAIRSFDRDNMTQDDAVFLRNIFNRKDESERVREAVLTVLAQVPSDDNIKFLLDVAKNPNESSQLRSRALRTVTRTSLSVDELIKIYDATDSRPMRQSLIEGLSNRREQAALNKLLEIAKCSTDPEVRSYTVRMLLNKNDRAITEQVLNLMSSTGAIKC